jgi:hypothetical protein
MCSNLRWTSDFVCLCFGGRLVAERAPRKQIGVQRARIPRWRLSLLAVKYRSRWKSPLFMRVLTTVPQFTFGFSAGFVNPYLRVFTAFLGFSRDFSGFVAFCGNLGRFLGLLS